MRQKWHLFISLGLTLLLVFVIYHQVADWQQAGKVMIAANPFFLILAVASVMLHIWIRAMRWSLLLSPAKHGLSLKTFFSFTVIKYFVNLIPPRAGEIAASVLLARKANVSAAYVIATSVLERMLDLVTLIALAGVYLIFFAHQYLPKSHEGKEILLALQNYSVKALAVSAIVLIALWLFLRKRHRGINWTRTPRFIGQFLDGFRVLHEGSTLVRAILLSIGIWLAIASQTWFSMRAYLEHFPYSGSLLLTVITAMGVAIPTPGGIGGFQYFMSLGLVHFFSAYMVSSDLYAEAAGISNGAYLSGMLPLFIIGFFLINSEELSLRTLIAINRISPDPDTPEPASN